MIEYGCYYKPQLKIRINQYLNPKVSSRSIKELEHNLDLSTNLTWQPMNVLVNLIPAFFLLALRFYVLYLCVNRS